MAIDYRAIMERIKTIQEGLSIAEPIATTVKRAYRYFPDASKSLTDLPCFINEWTATPIEYKSVLQTGTLEVHMQLLVKDADEDQAADIATAFYPQIVDAFAHVKLGTSSLAGMSGVFVRQLRSGPKTLTGLEFAGIPYIGLDLYLDLGVEQRLDMQP